MSVISTSTTGEIHISSTIREVLISSTTKELHKSSTSSEVCIGSTTREAHISIMTREVIYASRTFKGRALNGFKKRNLGRMKNAPKGLCLTKIPAYGRH